MKYSIGLFALSVLVLMGCASTGPGGAQKRSPKVKTEQSVPFTKGVEGTSLSKAGGSCHVAASSWDEMNWKRLNDNASKCVQQGKWSTVEKLGHYMAQKFYFSPWGMYYLSLYYEQAGATKKSLWYIEAALTKTGGALGLLYYQRGRVLLGLGDQVGAYDDFEKAAKMDPNLWDAHMYIGQQAYKDGDHNKSIEHLSRVFEHGGFTGKDHFQMLAHSLEARKKWPEALGVLDRGLRQHKDSLELRMQRARILEEETKDLRAALKAYEEILKIQAKDKTLNTASIKNKIDRIRKSLQQDKEERAPAAQEGKA